MRRACMRAVLSSLEKGRSKGAWFSRGRGTSDFIAIHGSRTIFQLVWRGMMATAYQWYRSTAAVISAFDLESSVLIPNQSSTKCPQS